VNHTAMRCLSRAVVGLSVLGSACGAVPTVNIGGDVQMPMLALGTYRGSLTTCTVQEGVQQWLSLGGRHIDTALDYGTQPDVGWALTNSSVPRSEIFITTKIPGPVGFLNATLMTETALRELGTDYIDLMLIHYPCPNISDFPDKCGSEGHLERLETWKGLALQQSVGKIRAVGVSNFNTEHYAELAQIGARPAVNQVEWHLGYHNETLLGASEAAGIHLEAWGSLSGPTTGRNPGVSLGDARLEQVAARYNVSTAQVALRWSVHKGVTPVTATCSQAHALGDLGAFGFDLSADDVAYLDSLTAETTPIVV